MISYRNDGKVDRSPNTLWPDPSELADALDAANADRDRLRSALTELVACKDAAGPSVSDQPGYRWHDAWEAARKAIA